MIENALLRQQLIILKRQVQRPQLTDPERFRLEVPRVDYEKLSGDRMGETGESIRKRVQAARDIQLARFSNIESSTIVANAEMHVGEIRQYCQLQDEDQSLMRAVILCCA